MTSWLEGGLAALRARSIQFAFGAAMIVLPATAQADYRLGVGDVLEISAVGIPELKQRMQIGQDGTVALPLAGQLRVAGMTLVETRARVRQLLPGKEFRRRTEEGREYPVILTPADIDVTVAEYRPVYLNGDVAKPGEQPYRPGMTVRQAVALAGGYDIMRFRMNNPFLEQSDLKSEYSSLWAEFAKEQVLVARLQAELSGKQDIDRQTLEKTPVPASVASEIERLGREQLALRNTDFSKEKVYLDGAVNQEDSRIKILSEQHKKEEAGVTADTEDLQRLQELYKNGNVVMTRIVEARRSLLLSSTRQLETAAQLAQVQRPRQEFSRRSDKLDDQRRLDLLAELQDANVKLAGIRSKLEASGEKLLYVGMVRSQLVRGNGSKPQIFLFRKNENAASERIASDEDAELLPGDVVEIVLQADLIPGLAAR
jgi:polysaccharide export outer membrane protein